MKRIYFTLIVTALISSLSFSQQGTIKIAKPENKAPKTSIIKKYRFVFGVGANTTFKNNNKIGYEVEAFFCPFLFPRNHGLYFGLKFSNEYQYYQISPYNTVTNLPDIGIVKSQNESYHLKVPICYAVNISRRVSMPGNNSIKADQFETKNFVRFIVGIEPKYLIRNNNTRLTTNEYNRYNLSGTCGISIPFNGKLGIFSLYFMYSKDFFENLKDKNIYNSMGEIIGSQNSKTNLFSFGIRVGNRHTLR